ncbi:glycosyltransferase family 2 protein [Thermoanaerobacterium thermosaccharolyticum]|uniref:glycosyltransferase family 2 protein n=1 Tax=Thermoanaerobacterium thermosaccharolyticum TaxID=1517 RepID=UPI00123C7422|nr:glycosyltransferase family 2 protein [Thermoanaerobacterium thermosaccharolyticum]KAA5805704.1 glycosyltransferase [Thermoanaerobacterium thermosaccharolyticum]
MPKVTVAIPTYNRAHYLKEAIESVLNQTYTDYELLVVDNASTDITEEVVKSFSDKRIKYIKNETNIGMVNNWNKCIDLAQGEYLIIFHDDDIMKPELLEKEVEILDNNDDIVLVATNISIIKDNGLILKQKEEKLTNNIIMGKYEFIYKLYKEKFFLPCPTVMMRLNFINQNNIRFRPEVGLNADGYMWMEINLHDKKMLFLHEPLLLYRHHENQNSIINFFERNINGYKYSMKLLIKVSKVFFSSKFR